MEVLILSCGTGGGHNAAGDAVAEELRRRGHRTTILNPYTLYSEDLAERINIKTVQKAPTIFGAVYEAGQIYRRMRVRSPVYFANRGMIPFMKAYLTRNRFDIIIAVHLFPAEILTCMKQKDIPIPKTIFLATDYVCIPFTEETDCDAYVIPSAELRESFISRGLPHEKIYPLGIPVNSRFSQEEIRRDVCERLCLDPDKRYILAAGGSMGGGKIKKVIQILADEVSRYENTELIVICGSNKQMYDELNGNNMSDVTVVGYTSDMAGYLKTADLFITKPGGLSSTEAAVCGIPMIHVAPIPGCETYNARFFSSYGMSRFCYTSSGELSDALEEIMSSKTVRDAMVRNQRKHIRPDAAVQISILAESMVLSQLENTRSAADRISIGQAQKECQVTLP